MFGFRWTGGDWLSAPLQPINADPTTSKNRISPNGVDVFIVIVRSRNFGLRGLMIVDHLGVQGSDLREQFFCLVDVEHGIRSCNVQEKTEIGRASCRERVDKWTG